MKTFLILNRLLKYHLLSTKRLSTLLIIYFLWLGGIVSAPALCNDFFTTTTDDLENILLPLPNLPLNVGTSLTTILSEMNLCAQNNERYIPVEYLTASKGTSKYYITLQWAEAELAISYRILRRVFGTKAWYAIADREVSRIYNDSDASSKEVYEYCVFVSVPSETVPPSLHFDMHPEWYQDFGFKKQDLTELLDRKTQPNKIKQPSQNNQLRLWLTREDSLKSDSTKISIPFVKVLDDKHILFHWTKPERAVGYELELVKQDDTIKEVELISILSKEDSSTPLNLYRCKLPETEGIYYFGVRQKAVDDEPVHASWLLIEIGKEDGNQSRLISVKSVPNPFRELPGRTLQLKKKSQKQKVDADSLQQTITSFKDRGIEKTEPLRNFQILRSINQSVLIKGSTGVSSTNKNCEKALLEYNLLESGKSITEWFLPMIHFNEDSHTLKYNDYRILSNIAKILRNNPDLRLIVEGHTDQLGKEANNNKLSYKRAKRIIDFMKRNHKICRERFELVSKGKNEALVPTKNSFMNRRVQFYLANPSADAAQCRN